MPVQALPFRLFQDTGVETKNRSLRYDLNAMADFEQATGMGLARLMSTSAIFATTRALLWAGLKHADRGLTIELVGMKMQQFNEAGGNIDDILKACLTACVEQKAVPNLKLTTSDGDESDEAQADPNAKTPQPIQTAGTTIAPGAAGSEA